MKLQQNIHLGFEIPTGDRVNVPVVHTCVTGQTQLSGKTTTLQALITRSQRRAIAFVTKRGEGSFTIGQQILPYFKESADWQFVESIIEATLKEKNKFQRAWVQKACRGAKTLADVQKNCRSLQQSVKRDMDKDQFMLLDSYFDIVIPQIATLPKTPKLTIGPGLNVMDLTEYTIEMQMLIVRSTIEWVHQNERGVITVIPEAWKFVPEGKGSPVKHAVEALIREGAGIQNFVWFDSQDIGGIDKTYMRSIPLWIIGVQRESNEIKRTLANIPAGSKQPKAKDIQHLRIGHFYACHGEVIVKTYVQPSWMEDDEAKKIAMGTKSTASSPPPSKITPVKKTTPTKGDEMAKSEIEGMREDIQSLNNNIGLLVKTLTPASATPAQPPAPAPAAPKPKPVAAPAAYMTPDQEQFYQNIKSRLIADGFGQGGIIQVMPIEKLRHDFQEEEVGRIMEAIKGLSPLAKKFLRFLETTTEYVGQATIATRLGRKNSGGQFTANSNAIKELTGIAVVEWKSKVGAKTTLRDKIAADLSFYQGGDEVVEGVYQKVLHHLATQAGE